VLDGRLTGDDVQHNGMWDLSIWASSAACVSPRRVTTTLRAELRGGRLGAGPHGLAVPKTPLGDDVPALRMWTVSTWSPSRA